MLVGKKTHESNVCNDRQIQTHSSEAKARTGFPLILTSVLGIGIHSSLLPLVGMHQRRMDSWNSQLVSSSWFCPFPRVECTAKGIRGREGGKVASVVIGKEEGRRMKERGKEISIVETRKEEKKGGRPTFWFIQKKKTDFSAPSQWAGSVNWRIGTIPPSCLTFNGTK